MSGDVQPRRRRDKKKKKEEQAEETPAQPQPPPTPVTPTVDINIHIHKEPSLGGGVCAKSIFFVLMIVISVIIGITITEHRGHTNVEIPSSQSRFASVFEGWVDKSTDGHGDDDFHLHSDGDLSQEEDEEDELRLSEEDDDEEKASSEESDDEEVEEFEDGEEEVTEEEEEEEYDQVASEEADEDIAAEESEIDEEDESEQEEIEEESEEQIGENIIDESKEQKDEIEDDYIFEEKEIIQESSEEAKDLDEDIEDGVVDDDNPELSAVNMAAKVGVGVSLLIVAYVVLVKKWKTDKGTEDDAAKEEQIPDLTRRNTFVPPPTLEEVEQDIENLEEDYSEDEEEIEESEDERKTIPASKRHYQELRSTYHRSMTPDSEGDYSKKKYEESEEEDEERGYEDREQYEEDVEEEEELEGEEEYEDDDDDDQLMKKLEARYGKLNVKSSKYADEEDEEDDEEADDKHFRSWKRVKSGNGIETDSDNDEPRKSAIKPKSGARNAYQFENITNSYDYPIRDDLDEAQRQLADNTPLALRLFKKLLEIHPDSPRVLYGIARALDLWAEKQRSNEILHESIQFYFKTINAEHVPEELFLAAADRCINRMRFIGNYARAIGVHKKLMQRFPNDSKYKNDLVVTYLTINRIPEARSVLIEILKRWPNDGLALVHYGFILKTIDNRLDKAIDYLKRGIKTREAGVIDGRFYFQLGDALTRLGRKNEAMKIYQDGVENKVFLSKYQRSLYNVERLTARPWWNKEQTPYYMLYEKLERYYKEIRKEGLSILNREGYFKDESENLRDVGDWKQFELYARGIKRAENCKRCPITCKIIDSEPDGKSCRRGQVKFSVMHPGTHVWPHCGPTNCRLRIHLGLKVPSKTYIRVADEIRSWEEGKVLIFDDSFEHEVWHNGTAVRLVLIIDVWHPELTKSEKSNLSAI